MRSTKLASNGSSRSRLKSHLRASETHCLPRLPLCSRHPRGPRSRSIGAPGHPAHHSHRRAPPARHRISGARLADGHHHARRRACLQIRTTSSELERNVIPQRVLGGVKTARARGRKRGRPRVMTGEKLRHSQNLTAERTRSIPAICRELGDLPNRHALPPAGRGRDARGPGKTTPRGVSGASGAGGVARDGLLVAGSRADSAPAHPSACLRSADSAIVIRGVPPDERTAGPGALALPRKPEHRRGNPPCPTRSRICSAPSPSGRTR